MSKLLEALESTQEDVDKKGNDNKEVKIRTVRTIKKVYPDPLKLAEACINNVDELKEAKIRTARFLQRPADWAVFVMVLKWFDRKDIDIWEDN